MGKWNPLPGGGVSSLDDLSDVDLSTPPTSGQALVWNGSSFVADTVSGGGGGALTEIATVQLASSATSISFSAIPPDHEDLILGGFLRTDRAGNTLDEFRVRMGNGSVDTGSNYRYSRSFINATGTASASTAETQSNPDAGMCAAGNVDAGVFSPVEATLFRYADASRHRHWLSRYSVVDTGGAASGICGVVWQNAAAAVDVVTLTPKNGTNFVAGSVLTLYGRGAL